MISSDQGQRKFTHSDSETEYWDSDKQASEEELERTVLKQTFKPVESTSFESKEITKQVKLNSMELS